MLTDEDITKLKLVLATKEDLSDSQTKLLSLLASKQELQEVKEDVADLKEIVQGIALSNDSLAKSIDTLNVEYAAISSQLTRHDLGIKQIADKVGVALATD